MKPSLRVSVGKSPFRMTLAIPIEDIISGIASMFSSTIAQEETTSKLVSGKHPHVLIHDGGEVDIQPCTQEEAIDAAQKMLKLIDLKNPKLYRVEGDRRVEVAGE